MINILSYVGMNMHSEVCLWTLLGLARTIFDATLFKVNANLKQVWQMSMPVDLSMPVQRALRTMISGVMLVQCFTVYVYLSSYIVMLYPVFLEERPTLVLPWLLLAAIRKLLCELTSLALGLGTCVLLGPARPSCIKFVIVKLVSIMPSFYMWMLLYGYYHALKVAAAFKTFTDVLPSSDHDYGLELAIRRRKTKSLLGEDQLRTKLVASLYGERPSIISAKISHHNIDISSRAANSSNITIEDTKTEPEVVKPMSLISNKSDTGSFEDWYGSDVVVPRDADRIMEQFVLMMLRIGLYLVDEYATPVNFDTFRRKSSHAIMTRLDNNNCRSMPADDTDTPPLVSSSKDNTASYVRDYPQIFMKRPSELPRASENKIAGVKTVHSCVENDDNGNIVRNRKRTVYISPNERTSLDIDVQSNKVGELENQRKQLNPTRQSTSSTKNPERQQTAMNNAPRRKHSSEINLDNILASSDSLRSIMENTSRLTDDTNKSNENESPNGTNKNEEKAKQD